MEGKPSTNMGSFSSSVEDSEKWALYFWPGFFLALSKPAFCVDHLTRSAFISRPFLCCLTPSSPHRRTQAILLIALGQSKPSGQSKPLGTWIIGLCMCAKSLQLCPTLCNLTHCSSLGSSVHEFSRQEYWSGLPCPSPGDIPYPEIERTSLTSPALAGKFFATSFPTWEAPSECCTD